jgi:hypothetical protein
MSTSNSTTARERWQRIVERQQRSGLSVTGFCRRYDVAASSLFAWKRRLQREGAPGSSSGFVAVQAPPDPSAPPVPPDAPDTPGRPGGGAAGVSGGAGSPLELHLGGGRSVVLRRGFDAQGLRELLAVLEGRS